MKNTNLIITILVITSVCLVVVPLKFISYQWLYGIHILVYFSLGYFLSLTNNQSFTLSAIGEPPPVGRAQMFLWTILLLALISTTFSYNLHEIPRCGEPLNIIIPPSYWVLMGVSGLTLAGSETMKRDMKIQSGLLYDYKKDTTLDGTVSWSLKNIPLERLQIILFLTISASAFAFEAFRFFENPVLDTNCIKELPIISETLSIMAAVSNGVYIFPEINRRLHQNS